jgi:hypothetical protein
LTKKQSLFNGFINFFIIQLSKTRILWIEENYISVDKDGYNVFKMYTYEDMVESGLIDELDLVDNEK